PALLALLDRRVALRVRVADRHDGELLDAVRREGGDDPGETRAEVVAYDPHTFDVERVEDREHVRKAVADPVRVDFGRLLGVAEPAEVGRDHAEARVDERRDLVAPDVMRVRKAVQEQHRRPAALVEDGELDAVTLDPPDQAST